MRLEVGSVKVFYLNEPSPRFDVRASLPGHLSGEQVLDVLDSILRFAVNAIEDAKRVHDLPDWKSAAQETITSEYTTPTRTDD